MIDNPLSLISTAFKFAWIKYKLDKAIKKREPYIKALIRTEKGRLIQRAILEMPGSKVFYLEVKSVNWDSLENFEDEHLLNVISRVSINDNPMYSFKLTDLGKRYFSR